MEPDVTFLTDFSGEQMNEPAEEEVKPSSGCGAVSPPAVAKVATVVTLTNPQNEDSASAGPFDCLGGCCCYRDLKQVETSVETDRLISTNFIDQQHSGYGFLPSGSISSRRFMSTVRLFDIQWPEEAVWATRFQLLRSWPHQ